MKEENDIHIKKGLISITRINQELQEKDSGKNSRNQESDKNCKKKRIRQEVKKIKNQSRRQEHKNLVWRGISCFVRQDSVYKNITRRSRSVFSGKNLV
jgi:hypothetical protein